MREIKFRGLRKVGKKMIFGDLAKLMHVDNLCIMPDSFYGTRDFDNVDGNGNPKIEDYLAIGGFYPVIKETVGEFTGLTDKNGKEIYEGDIVIHSIKSEFLDSSDWCLIYGEVISINGWWCVKEERYPLYAFENEVIGNIHENPELL